MALANGIKLIVFRHLPTTTQFSGLFHGVARGYRCSTHGNCITARFPACWQNYMYLNRKNGQHRRYKSTKAAKVKSHDIPYRQEANTSIMASIIAKRQIGPCEDSLEEKPDYRKDDSDDKSLRSLSEAYKAVKKDLGDLYSRQSENSAEDADEDEAQSDLSDSSYFVENLSLDDNKKVVPKRKAKGVRSIFGSADPSIPFSEVPCAGCGATLHCQNTAIPGYMPKEKFLPSTQRELKRMVCQKCYLMTYCNFCLNVRATPEEYTSLISSVRHRKGLIVLVVDTTDITNSMIKGLPQLIGEGRKYFIVGTKVDLLPGVPTENLNHCHKVLLDWCLKCGLGSRGSVIEHVSLISAKTGYGIEELVNKLLKKFNHASEGDVFLLGSTNSGKSTLFNALLSSDYCKYHVRDVIHRATVSRWPGTTIDLLKFPILAPSRERLYLRTQRLIKEKAEKTKRDKELIKRSKNPNILRNVTLTGTIGQTDFRQQPQEEEKDEEEVNYQRLIIPPSYSFTREGDVSVGSLTKNDLHRVTAAEEKARVQLEDDLERLTKSRWLFDTPGLVNSDQVINLLTAEELAIALPAARLQPRSYVLKPGQVMFVSGLGRIDYVQGLKSIYLTVLAAKFVPVHVIDPNSEDPDKFYQQAVGTKQLGVPLGTTERLMSIPALVGQEYEVTGRGWRESAADIILSSIGFVSVTLGEGLSVVLRAYTPGGRGCRLHSPALLPTAVNMRGKRMKGTAKYSIRKGRDMAVSYP